MCARSVTPDCDPMDSSPPGSSVCGIFQARILEWLPFPTPGDLPEPGIEPMSFVSPALAGGFFTSEPPEKPSKTVLHQTLVIKLVLTDLRAKLS